MAAELRTGACRAPFLFSLGVPYLIYYSTHAVPNLRLTPRQGEYGCGGGGGDYGCLYYSTHVVPNLLQTRRLWLWRRRPFAARRCSLVSLASALRELCCRRCVLRVSVVN